MAVANATAAIAVKAPPYVTYRVRGVVHVANGDADISRSVTVRTDDGDAVVHDDPTGKDVLRPPFPAAPTFDALSEFTLAGVATLTVGGKSDDNHRDFDMRIVNVEPLHYVNSQSSADAVARSVRGYTIVYANDATPALGHLHLEPTAAKRAERHWLRDVWYDPATLIPTRVVYGGPEDFVLDARYTTVDGHWLLGSIAVSVIKHAPLWLGRMTIAFHGDYAGYQFSETSPDPRLVPAASPSPR